MMKRYFVLFLVAQIYAFFFWTAARSAEAQTMPSIPPQQSSGTQELRRPQIQLPTAQGAIQAAPEDISRVPMVPGDVLSVQVFDAPDLSGMFTVDSSGELTLPLVGKIPVNGLTLSETQAKIVAALSDRYILHPSVSITVQQYVPTYVTIMGEVQSPGRYPLLASHSLQQVLAMAGGPTLLAAGVVDLKRQTQNSEQRIEAQIRRTSSGTTVDNTEVQPGDEIDVPRAGVVYVLGAVNRPGGYVMQEMGALNVVQAIALAAGTTMQASIHSMRVVRRGEGGSLMEIDVDYRRMVAGRVPAITLRPQDIVYVPVSKAKAILTGGSGVIAAASSAAIYTY